jgi:hypothetical protein
MCGVSEAPLMDQYLPERRRARGWSGHRSAPSSMIPRCRSSSAHRAARTVTDVCGPRLPRTLEHGSGGGRGGRPPIGGGTRASHRGASSCPGSPERCERKRAMIPIPWQSVLTLILGSGNRARENSRDSLSLLRVFSGAAITMRVEYHGPLKERNVTGMRRLGEAKRPHRRLGQL